MPHTSTEYILTVLNLNPSRESYVYGDIKVNLSFLKLLRKYLVDRHLIKQFSGILITCKNQRKEKIVVRRTNESAFLLKFCISLPVDIVPRKVVVYFLSFPGIHNFLISFPSDFLLSLPVSLS